MIGVIRAGLFLDEGKQLGSGFRTGFEYSPYCRGYCHRAWFPYPPHGHTHMLGLYNYPSAIGLKSLENTIGDLRG